MRNIKNVRQISVLVLTGLTLVACAPFFENGFSWHPPSGARLADLNLQPTAGYYESAVNAINARHYALALEYLQAARGQKPDDVRVLTAFGVVYDKLGRFDLSARYYAQAAALDPRSKIISADLEYSRKLQGLVDPAKPAPLLASSAPVPHEGIWHKTQVEQAGAAPDDGGRDTAGVSPASTEAGTAIATIPAPKSRDPVTSIPKKAVFLTGHPLAILDSSESGGSAMLVSKYLSSRGWTTPRTGPVKEPARALTTIVYEQSMITVARALARTLSLPMRLEASDQVQGLQLLLGRDIAHVNFRANPQSRPGIQVAAANTGRKVKE